MSLSSDEIQQRFAGDDSDLPADKRADVARVRMSVQVCAEGLAEILPHCRESSLAYTKLEEAMFWAEVAIKRARRRHIP